jgi:hypothetical protein
MSRDEGFAERRCGREEEYFHRKEKELIQAMRARADREAERRFMGEVLGVADEAVLSNLQELGYTRETVRLMYLVPLVHTAWAEGSITRRERGLILAAAAIHGIEEGSPAYFKLRHWLDNRPEEEFFEKTLRVIAAMLESLPPEKYEQSKQDLVAYCTQIAEVSGGIMGFVNVGRSIRKEEREVLELIVAELDAARAVAP